MKKSVLLLAGLSLLLSCACANGDLLDGLAAYYALDGNANDGSGNGNNGVVYGATPTSDRLGAANSAYSFDGVNDYISIPDSSSLNISGNLTISAWIRTSSYMQTIFDNMLAVSPHSGYSLMLDIDGKLHFTSGEYWLYGNTQVNTNSWTHVAATLSGTTASFYVNGVLDNSGTVGVPTSNTVAQTIGASNDPFYFWNGLLDDVRVYNRQLSYAEIRELADLEMYWTGAGGAAWNTSATNNWKNSGGSPIVYGDGAAVIFDDTASSTTADISTVNVSPSRVTFNNSSKAFSITGSKGIAGTGTLLKQGTNTVTISSVNTYSGLTTVEDGVLQLNGTGARNPVLNLGGVKINGGKLVMDYSSSASPAAQVRNLLTASYSGDWATGQFQSEATDDLVGLGWKDESNQVTVQLAIYGDADMDGSVGLSDLGKVQVNWGNGGKDWSIGDFNYDGNIGLADLGKIQVNWGQTMSSAVSLGQAVPEPSSIAMLAGLLSLAGVLAVRRRVR